MFLLRIPTLLYVLIVYNVIAYTNLSGFTFSTQIIGVPLISGAIFSATVNDLLLALGIAALTVEIFKATRIGTTSVIDHVLSTLLLLVFLVQFLTAEPAGTATYLLLTLMSLADVIVGFLVTISTSRRDFSVGNGG